MFCGAAGTPSEKCAAGMVYGPGYACGCGSGGFGPEYPFGGGFAGGCARGCGPQYPCGGYAGGCGPKSPHIEVI